jgi:hypothetical protein
MTMQPLTDRLDRSWHAVAAGAVTDPLVFRELLAAMPPDAAREVVEVASWKQLGPVAALVLACPPGPVRKQVELSLAGRCRNDSQLLDAMDLLRVCGEDAACRILQSTHLPLLVAEIDRRFPQLADEVAAHPLAPWETVSRWGAKADAAVHLDDHASELTTAQLAALALHQPNDPGVQQLLFAPLTSVSAYFAKPSRSLLSSLVLAPAAALLEGDGLPHLTGTARQILQTAAHVRARWGPNLDAARMLDGPDGLPEGWLAQLDGFVPPPWLNSPAIEFGALDHTLLATPTRTVGPHRTVTLAGEFALAGFEVPASMVIDGLVEPCLLGVAAPVTVSRVLDALAVTGSDDRARLWEQVCASAGRDPALEALQRVRPAAQVLDLLTGANGIPQLAASLQSRVGDWPRFLALIDSWEGTTSELLDAMTDLARTA